MAPNVAASNPWTSFVSRVKSTLPSTVLNELETELPGWEALAKTSAGRAAINKSISSIQAAGGDIGTAVNATQNVNDFLTRLTEQVTWERVAEFAIGAMLIYIGIKALFPSEISAVTSPVKKAAKVGAVL